MEGPIENPAKLSRRDFIKLTGIGLGSLAAEIAAPRLIGEIKASKTSKQETLTKHGLEDFIPIQEVQQKMFDLFGANWGHCIWFSKLVNQAANNDLVGPSVISQLNDGWGNKTIDAKRPFENKYYIYPAKRKIDEMSILNKDIPKKEKDEIKTKLKLFADLFPGLVVVGPDTLKITDDGTGQIRNPYKFLEEIRPEFFLLKLPSVENLDLFFPIVMHEYNHINESNRIKACAKKNDYLDTNRFEMETVFDLLEDYFSRDWEEVKYYKNGYTLVPLRKNTKKSLKNLHNALINQEIINKGEIPPDDTAEYYNWLIHHAGKHCMKKPYKQQLKEYPYEKFKTISGLTQMALTDLNHYLIDSPRKPDLGLPSNLNELASPGNKVSQAQRDIYLKRLKTFSTLTPKELTDFNTASVAVKKKLGLPL